MSMPMVETEQGFRRAPSPHISALTFLDELFSPYPVGDGLTVEVRCIDPKREPKDPEKAHVEWFGLKPPYLALAAIFAISESSSRDSFVGVLPRLGKTKHAQDVTCACWLWADVDAGGSTGKQVLSQISAANLPIPRLWVASGSGGCHLYWRLPELVLLPDAESRDRFKNLLKRIVVAIGGKPKFAHADSAAAECARILRIPQTVNHKHDPPRMVEALRTTDEPRPVTWWDANLPFLPSPRPQRQPPYDPTERALELASQGIPLGYLRWANKPYPEGNRHKDLAAAACWLIKDKGFPPHVAEELLVQKAESSQGQRRITREEVAALVKWAA